MPPMPYQDASEAYADRFIGLMQSFRGGAEVGGPPSQKHINMLNAQSLWDATMAHSICQVLKDGVCERVVHICGSFHMKDGLGIPEHITAYRPQTSVATIVSEN